MSHTEIGDTLRKLRGKKRRADVAMNIGVSISALAMYERGERIPRDEIKLRIAQFYGKSVQEIFFSFLSTNSAQK